ncbi:hypothetical protein [Streptomyces violaceusniger]|uniref:Uncharacterized protein n=1 Tax=Streptomyces violaceusniger (strain Tu 4113) TaxID=653045 RepID=G2NWU4_STRV4|nr:hypothetical protein [Streptomyces violaceusniger]AEM87128.1 hypothetical protein Strvi_7795 [Streptomyces violaceusniger Tu 4113]
MGIYYLPEESDPTASPEAIELIFKESGSLGLASGTDWTLRIEKGTWPELPQWCHPRDAWTYRDISTLPEESLGKILSLRKQVNEHGDLVQAELQFEGGSRIAVTSGESLELRSTSTRDDSRLPPEEEFKYLLEYAHDDWLGFSVISGAVASILGKGASQSQLREMTVRLIGDLYDRGVRAGDLTSSDAHPFAPWSTTKGETLDRIRSEMAKLPGLPDSGDICWFTVP